MTNLDILLFEGGGAGGGFGGFDFSGADFSDILAIFLVISLAAEAEAAQEITAYEGC